MSSSKYRPTICRLSVKYRQRTDRHFDRLSIGVSTKPTINKHDPKFKDFLRVVLTPYRLPTSFPKFNSLLALISSQLQPGTFICMLKPVHTCLIPNTAVFTDLGGGFEFFQFLLCLPSCLFFSHAVFDHNFLIFGILWVKIMSIYYFDQFSAMRFLSPTQKPNGETLMD